MIADRFGIVGTVIASAYHVESVVAEGGFGVVYRARHGGFRAPVALKCLKVPQHLAPEHESRFLEQFRAEAELMFRLSASTPTVTRPLHVDVMTTPNGSFVPFMVLEWLEGDTLDALIRARAEAGKRPLSLPELVELLGPVATALDRAHHFKGPSGAESIAHCDLKPENVFVASVNGETVVKILDFGVANVRGAATLAAKGNANELALFTPAYGAPEQWNPKQLGEMGPWTDVWGLALTLVEALAGRPVITGDHTGLRQQILDRQRRPSPRQQGIVVSDRVEAVFVRALAVEPRDRQQDAGAFWKALSNAVGRADLPSTPSGPEIPDLVPLERKPSHPELAAVRGPATFDFDDTESAAGTELALDLPPDEPVPRRSLSPVSMSSVMQPTSHGDVISVPPGPTSLPRAGLPAASLPRGGPVPPNLTPSLAPMTPRGASRALEPTRSQEGERASTPPISRSSPAPVERTLVQRLVPGVALAAASIVLTLLDRVYAGAAGEVFTLGPVRTSWVAAALLVGGLGLVTRELLSRR